MSTRPIRELATPLRTLEPAAADNSDLAALRDVVGQARVVCLGESAHFTSEFTRLRDRVLRYLVSELGFSAFVLESGLSEGLAVDRWIRGGPGDLTEIARSGISYAFGRCVEMHAPLRWMREWNATHEHQVGFYGMDMPGWCSNPVSGVAACLSRIPARSGDRELLAAADLDHPANSPATGAVGAPAGLPAALAELIARADAAGDGLARQCARGASRVVELLEHGLYPGPGRNLRNEVMAENLRWILEREERVLVGAHNVHLQRSPSFDGTAPVGSLLAPTLGDDLVVIGGTHAVGRIPDLDLSAQPEERYFASGEEPPPPAEHTLEAAMEAAGYPIHLVAARHASEALADAVAMRAQTPHQSLLVDLDPQQAFDAVLHTRRITPVRGAPD